MSNPLRLPKNLHTLLTYLPKQAQLPRIRRALRTDYDAADLTPDEALLISAALAYDKRGAARLLQESGKPAWQIVRENPRKKARANWRKRLRTWLRSLEGSESLAQAYNRTLFPDNRKDILDDSESDDWFN